MSREPGMEHVTESGLNGKLQWLDMRSLGPLWGPGKDGDKRHVGTSGSIKEAGSVVRRLCEKADAKLLVIDPLAAAYGSDENIRALVREFMSDWSAWSAATGVTTMILGHPPKSDSKYSGSTDWHSASRFLLTPRPRGHLVHHEGRDAHASRRRADERGQEGHEGREGHEAQAGKEQLLAHRSRRVAALDGQGSLLAAVRAAGGRPEPSRRRARRGASPRSLSSRRSRPGRRTDRTSPRSPRSTPTRVPWGASETCLTPSACSRSRIDTPLRKRYTVVMRYHTPTRTVQLRVPVDLYNRIEHASKSYDMTVSEAIRLSCRMALGEKVDPFPGITVPRCDKRIRDLFARLAEEAMGEEEEVDE